MPIEDTPKPDWFPDWDGQCAAIVAAGPSVKQADVDLLKNRIHVVVINESHRLAPWAEFMYSCDNTWWKARGDADGCDKFGGIKVTWNPDAVKERPELKKIEIKTSGGVHNFVHELCMDKYGEVGGGGNSGFQVLNLLAQFGCKGIGLIGFDYRWIGNDVHWHGRHVQPMNNPSECNFRFWIEKMTPAAVKLKLLGIDVVNCSQHSALTCFPKMTVSDMLGRWQL